MRDTHVQAIPLRPCHLSVDNVSYLIVGLACVLKKRRRRTSIGGHLNFDLVIRELTRGFEFLRDKRSNGVGTAVDLVLTELPLNLLRASSRDRAKEAAQTRRKGDVGPRRLVSIGNLLIVVVLEDAANEELGARKI